MASSIHGVRTSNAEYALRIAEVKKLLRKHYTFLQIVAWSKKSDKTDDNHRGEPTGRPWALSDKALRNYVKEATREIHEELGYQREKAKIDAGEVEENAPGPKEFRAGLLIDHDGKAVPFKPDVWQEEDFESLDEAWMVVAGMREERAKVRRSWQERPRGHSKTSDLALMAAWALRWSKKAIRGIAGAASQKQAGLLRDSIETLIRMNDSLKVLKIQKWEVINERTGSMLDILPSDTATSYGQNPDFVIADEVSHWPEGKGESFWHSLFSSSDKRGHCLLVVITNAGFMESWVWKVREAIRERKTWHFSHLDGPKGSWITPDRLDEEQHVLPQLVYDRLWNNIWSAGSGDAITEADIQASLRRDGPLGEQEAGWVYFAGVDLSVSQDDAALVILGKKQNLVRLCRVVAWRPPKKGKIDFSLVRQTILDLNGVFHPRWMIDPYQAELLADELTRAGVVVETVSFTAKNLMEMASSMIEVFSARQIELFNDVALINDIRRLRIKESAGGYRLAAPRTGEGHVDRATALSLAVLGARRAGTFFWGITLEKPTPTVNDCAPRGVYLEGGVDMDDSYRILHPMEDEFVGGMDLGKWGPPGGV